LINEGVIMVALNWTEVTIALIVFIILILFSKRVRKIMREIIEVIKDIFFWM